MKEDIKGLLETICEMAQYTECDLVYVEKIANKYGFTVGDELQLEEI